MMLEHMDANVGTWKPACDIAQDIAASAEEQSTLQTRAEAIHTDITALIEGTGLLVTDQGLDKADKDLQALIDGGDMEMAQTGAEATTMDEDDEPTSTEDIEQLITDIKDLGVALSALHV